MVLTQIIYIPIIVVIAIAAPIAIIALLNWGKQLKCPNCAHQFKAP